jgi:toxin-antitoxin system PIN domain toxin
MSFLEDRIADPDIMCLAWPTLVSYLRISTHSRIFARPLSPAEACSNLETLLSLPRVRVLSENEGFLEIYREVTSAFPVRGNLVPDAHLAALLRQHGVRRLYTNDADFRKFAFLDVRNPFSV